MYLIRIFGAILTMLGIIGLTYTGMEIINHNGSAIMLIIVGFIALFFFFFGRRLVKMYK